MGMSGRKEFTSKGIFSSSKTSRDSATIPLVLGGKPGLRYHPQEGFLSARKSTDCTITNLVVACKPGRQLYRQGQIEFGSKRSLSLSKIFIGGGSGAIRSSALGGKPGPQRHSRGQIEFGSKRSSSLSKIFIGGGSGAIQSSALGGKPGPQRHSRGIVVAANEILQSSSPVSSLDVTLLEKFLLEHHRFLHDEIYCSQCLDQRNPNYVSVKEYLELYGKLVDSDLEAWKAFLIKERIRVSIRHISQELLKRPMGRVIWKMPAGEWKKLNFSASYRTMDNIGYFSGGVSIRDDVGEVTNLRNFLILNANVNVVIDAEFEALRRGLILAFKCGYSRIVIEGDNKTLMDNLRGIKPIPKEELIKYWELFGLLTWFEDYEVCFTFREGNRLADYVASLVNPLGIGEGFAEDGVNKWKKCISDEDLMESDQTHVFITSDQDGDPVFHLPDPKEPYGPGPWYI